VSAAAAVSAPTAISRTLPSRLLALTVTTGVIDAASYIGLGHVFTANMTGNVVLLGFGLAGAGGLPVLAPIISLGAFMLGARAGGIFASSAAAAGGPRLDPALSCEGALVLVAAVLAAVIEPKVGSLAAYVVIGLLALAMGVRNAVVRKIGFPDLTTTVLTMTITGLASEPLRGEHRMAHLRRLLAVGAMLIGALIGGLLVERQLAAPLWLAAAIALGCRASNTVIRRRHPRENVA
jgi:uncharacterized membrane protein YoaK (UPF0700 family)